MNFSSIKEKGIAYLDLSKQREESDLDGVLAAVVDEGSKQVFESDDKLRTAMLNAGASDIQIEQVLIMTKVSGFSELIRRGNGTEQADLDCYIQNAVDETGFSKQVVMRLTSSIANAVGIAFTLGCMKPLKTSSKKAFVIPNEIYQRDLSSFEAASLFGQVPYEKLPSDQLSNLESLVAAGIPQAKRYLGNYMLNECDGNDSSSVGVKLLEEAANDGDVRAAGLLGDYYFSQAAYSSNAIKKAYEYYTDYGAAALTKPRRDSLVKIINQRSSNRKTLIFSIVLTLVMIALLILAPGKAVFGRQLVVGIVCLALTLIADVFAVLRYREYPFDSVAWLPVFTVLVWLAFQAIRIIF